MRSYLQQERGERKKWGDQPVAGCWLRWCACACAACAWRPIHPMPRPRLLHRLAHRLVVGLAPPGPQGPTSSAPCVCRKPASLPQQSLPPHLSPAPVLCTLAGRGARAWRLANPPRAVWRLSVGPLTPWRPSQGRPQGSCRWVWWEALGIAFRALVVTDVQFAVPWAPRAPPMCTSGLVSTLPLMGIARPSSLRAVRLMWGC
jgi:hypothetical protein